MKKTLTIFTLIAALCFAIACIPGCGNSNGEGSNEDAGTSDPLATTLGTTGSSNIIMHDGTLYYSNFSIGDESDISVPNATRMPVDTVNFLFYDGSIYYTQLPVGTSDDPTTLYRCDENGENAVTLATDCDCWTQFYIVDGKLLYNYISDDYTNFGTKAIDLSAEDAEPTELKSSDGSSIIIRASNSTTIYYTKIDDYDSLFSSDASMSNEEKLDVESYNYCLLDDEGDFITIDDENSTIKVFPSDGSSPLTYVVSVDLAGSIYYGGNIYAADGTTVHVISLQSGDVESTIDLAAGDIVYLNYIDDTSVIYTSYMSDWNGEEYDTQIYYQDIEGDAATECGRYFSS